MGALLGDRRIKVYRDGRIEGGALLEAESNPAPRRTSGPGVSVVAGGRYAPREETRADCPVRLAA